MGRHVAGVVAEADLLSAQERCLREAQLESGGDVREMLAQLPQVNPGDVTITAHNGIVTLACMLGSAEKHDLIRVAGRLAWTLMACTVADAVAAPGRAGVHRSRPTEPYRLDIG